MEPGPQPLRFKRHLRRQTALRKPPLQEAHAEPAADGRPPMGGPSRSTHSTTGRPPPGSARQNTVTRPPGTDRVPYLVAFVASSCSAMAKNKAGAGGSLASEMQPRRSIRGWPSSLATGSRSWMLAGWTMTLMGRSHGRLARPHRKLGGDYGHCDDPLPARPKGMRHRTYERLWRSGKPRWIGTKRSLRPGRRASSPARAGRAGGVPADTAAVSFWQRWVRRR